ncbi:ABC transporter substrate-binding protein [Aureimonas flava]|nr:ABC transporter substrate-binding protein [Aureimonas flava]
MIRTPPRLALAIVLAAAPLAGAAAQTADGIVVGIAAPLTGPSDILGRQIAVGAERASSAAGVGAARADTGCTTEGGREAVAALTEARATLAVGFLCAVALEAALPGLTAAGIPVIDVGVRATRIQRHREKDGALLWRLAPAADAEVVALSAFVREHWPDSPFAMVEDGSPQSRDLADKLRQALDESGLRASVTDTYRPAEEKQFPLVRRLRQSGVMRVLFLGARSDTAIILRDAAEIGLSIEAVGGESLVDAADGATLPAGVTAVASGFDVDWTPSETAPEDEGYARVARVGAEIAIEAARRASAEGRTLADVLNVETFVTSAGLVRFRGDGSADIVPFRPYRWDGTRFLAQTQG